MEKINFDAENHVYTINGVEYPSVTHVIRFCSYDQAKNADPYMAMRARELGTEVHEATEYFDYTGEVPEDLSQDAIPYLEAYVQFKREHIVKWDYIEHITGSSHCGLCGTVDRIGYVDGNLCILDIKTSSKVNVPSLSAQLYWYYKLCMREFGKKEDGDFKPKLYGLQLMKNGKYRLYECNYYDGLMLANECFSLHKNIERMKGKRYAV